MCCLFVNLSSWKEKISTEACVNWEWCCCTWTKKSLILPSCLHPLNQTSPLWSLYFFFPVLYVNGYHILVYFTSLHFSIWNSNMTLEKNDTRNDVAIQYIIIHLLSSILISCVISLYLFVMCCLVICSLLYSTYWYTSLMHVCHLSFL